VQLRHTVEIKQRRHAGGILYMKTERVKMWNSGGQYSCAKFICITGRVFRHCFHIQRLAIIRRYTLL